jgi:hypothetical protein
MRDTIDMAREAGIDAVQQWNSDTPAIELLKAFEALVRADEREETNRRANASWTLMCEKMVAAEREACAKVCDDLSPPCGYNLTEISFWDVTSLECAAAIRERSANAGARGNT